MTDKTKAMRLANDLDAYHTRKEHKQAASLLRGQAERIEVLEKEIEELKFLKGDLLYWVDRAVSKGNANTDIEEAHVRWEEWIEARTALEQSK